MFSSRTMLAADWATIKHFQPLEFVDHGNGQNCSDKMGWEFVQWLDHTRELAAVPMTITSSYRDPAHNAAVGGASHSAHMEVPCNAVDVMPAGDSDREKIDTAAVYTGCVRRGIYKDGSMHLDRAEATHPAPALWVEVD